MRHSHARGCRAIAAFLTCAVLHASAHGQEHPPRSVHQDFMVGLEYLPTTTPLVIGSSNVNARWADLEASALGRLLAHPSLQKLSRGALAEAAKDVRTRLQAQGLDMDEVIQALGNGATFALTSVSRGRPSPLLIVRLGDHSKVIRARLEHLLKRHVSDRGVKGKAEIFLLNGLNGIAVAFDGSMLLVAQDVEEIERALQRAHGDDQSCLAGDPDFRSFVARVRKDDFPMLSAYVKVGSMIPLATSALDARTGRRPAGTPSVQSVVDALGLAQIKDVGFVTSLAGESVRDLYYVSNAGPWKGWLRLFSQPGLDPSAAAAVPEDCDSFTVIRFPFDQILAEAKNTADKLQPGSAKAIESRLRALSSSPGVDVQEHILGALGSQVVMFGKATNDQVPSFTLVIELEDAAQFGRAFKKLPALGLPLSNWSVDGVPVTGFGDPAEPALGMAVAGNRLIVGNGPGITHGLKQIESGKPSRRAATMMAALAPDVTQIGWTHMGRQVASVVGNLSSSGLPLEIDAAELSRIAGMLGEATSTLRSADNSLEYEVVSPVGSLWMPVAVASAIALPYVVKQGTQATEVAPIALSQVFEAQKRHVARTDVPPRYGTFGEMVEANTLGAIQREFPMDGASVWKGYRLTILLPPDEAARALHFAATAVPVNRAPDQTAYFVDERGTVYANRIILSLGGDSMLSPEDLYQDGAFGGTPAPGWEPAKQGPTSARAAVEMPPLGPPLKELSPRKRVDAIASIEKRKDRRAIPELMDLLRDATPGIPARAAFALGQLNAREAVEPLCTAAQQTEDADLRLHAVHALARIKDPKAAATLIACLDAEPATLRTAAAAGLGAMRSQPAVKPLLKMLAVHGEDEPAHRTQAVLALADIGDASCLAPLAAAVKSADPDLTQAVAWSFQTLSQKLPPAQELHLLLSVLDHDSLILRKFAIQRLGELGNSEALPALAKRLEVEGPVLAPILRTSISALNGGSVSAASPDAGMRERVIQQGRALWTATVTGFKGLDEQTRMIVALAPAAIAILLALVWLVRRRARAVRSSEEMKAFLQPSEEEEFAAEVDEEPFKDDEFYVPDETTAADSQILSAAESPDDILLSGAADADEVIESGRPSRNS